MSFNDVGGHPEDGDSKFHWNVGIPPYHIKVSQPRKLSL